MYKAVCVNAKGSNVLREGKEYFGFPVNEFAIYISNFPKQTANMGCFQLERFVLQPVPVMEELEKNQDDTDNRSKSTLEQLSLFD